MRSRDLPVIRVARPCREPWAAMPGDDRVRHCGKCDKDVHDLSTLGADEIRALFARGTPWCGRVFRRADGTVVTADCSDRPRVVAAAALGLALASAACGHLCPTVQTGYMAVSPPPPPPPAQTAPATYDFDEDDLIMGELDADEMLGVIVPVDEPLLEPPKIDAADPPDP